jgi:2'-5' RNA ligase
VAIPLPEPARDAVASIVARARSDEPEGSRVRWVRLDGLHLTLRFLGPTPPDRVASLEQMIVAIAASEPTFGVELAGAGAFPTTGRPRVLWLDVAAGADHLAGLAGRVDEALAERGWPRDERSYRAHLTLARTDGAPGGRSAADAVAKAAAGLRTGFTAAEVALMETRSGRGPARYERLMSAALAGRPRDP